MTDTVVKQDVDIEKLLCWAFRDELPKKQLSAAEGIWNRIEEYGQRGGIDPGHGAAQRYSHFGLPHPDADVIEKAVQNLPDVAIDWANSIGPIGGELAGLLTVNDLTRRPDGAPGHKTTAGWTDKKTGKWKSVENRPRDMLMVQSFRPSVLIASHAKMSNRPDWWDEQPHPKKVIADHGGNPKVDGSCEGKNRYSLGSSCPLNWLPSPISVITARAEYAVWWEALNDLAGALNLAGHVALPPSAPAAPWFGEVDNVGDVIVVPPSGQLLHLPLAPRRGRMLSPFRRPTAGPVRYPLEEKSV